MTGDSNGTAARPTAWLFDMDGTLADVSGIRHYVRPPNRDFDRFHGESINCPPHAHVVQLARDVRAAGHTVIVLTARRETFWWQTKLWLLEQDVPHDHLAMRASWDYRHDQAVKAEILARIRPFYDVVHAVDDRPEIIALWKAEGIPTTVVPGWETDTTEGEHVSFTDLDPDAPVSGQRDTSRGKAAL